MSISSSRRPARNSKERSITFWSDTMRSCPWMSAHTISRYFPNRSSSRSNSSKMVCQLLFRTNLSNKKSQKMRKILMGTPLFVRKRSNRKGKCRKKRRNLSSMTTAVSSMTTNSSSERYSSRLENYRLNITPLNPNCWLWETISLNLRMSSLISLSAAKLNTDSSPGKCSVTRKAIAEVSSITMDFGTNCVRELSPSGTEKLSIDCGTSLKRYGCILIFL